MNLIKSLSIIAFAVIVILIDAIIGWLCILLAPKKLEQWYCRGDWRYKANTRRPHD